MPSFRPEDLPVRLRYNLLIGAVVPRPIAVVGTVDREGRSNLAPYSFFNAFSSEPMILGFCPVSGPDGAEKDSLRNAKPAWEGGTGCFTVSVATEAILKRVVAAGEPLPPGESEFDLSGLTAVRGREVGAPFVAESPVAFECETVNLMRFAPGRPNGGNLVVGQVRFLHVRDDLVNERMHVDADRLAAVGRMGGNAYARTRDRVELPIGKEALGIRLPWE